MWFYLITFRVTWPVYLVKIFKKQISVILQWIKCVLNDRKKKKDRVLAGWHSIGVVPTYHNWVIKKANGKIFQLSTQTHKGIICKWPAHISGDI